MRTIEACSVPTFNSGLKESPNTMRGRKSDSLLSVSTNQVLTVIPSWHHHAPDVGSHILSHHHMWSVFIWQTLKIPLFASLTLSCKKVFVRVVISLNLAFHKKWRYTAVVPHQDAWSGRITSSRPSGVTQWNAIKEEKMTFLLNYDLQDAWKWSITLCLW